MIRIDAEYSEPENNNMWNKAKNILKKRRGQPDIQKNRRAIPNAPRYRLGTHVRAPDWDTECKVKTVAKEGDSWKYQLIKNDGNTDYENGSWQEEGKLFPLY